MDTALLLLRLLLGALLFAHATQKLFGWFQGPGLQKQAGAFESLGLRPGRPLAVLAALAESGAAVLLVLGLATPLAALMAAGTMAVAMLSLTLRSGVLWAAAGGGEYPGVLALLAVVLGFSGPGGYSLDAVLARSSDSLAFLVEPPAWIGVVVLLVAVAAAVPFAVVMRRARRATAG
ncbi:MAG TPA: DoxX family protein [Cellulomonas sp.]